MPGWTKPDYQSLASVATQCCEDALFCTLYDLYDAYVL